jgi:hypothetical protein
MKAKATRVIFYQVTFLRSGAMKECPPSPPPTGDDYAI